MRMYYSSACGQYMFTLPRAGTGALRIFVLGQFYFEIARHPHKLMPAKRAILSYVLCHDSDGAFENLR